MSRPRSKATKAANVRFRGPLTPFAGELEARLRGSGYTPLTTASVLRLCSHLSRWLAANTLDVGDLSSPVIERYFAHRREAGRTYALTAASLAPLMAVLAESGALPIAGPPEPATPDEQLLASFEHYLRVERALASETTGAYLSRARRFLDGRGGMAGLFGLGAGDVTAAVLQEAEVSVGSAQHFVAALRAFLRYLFLEGLLDRDLSTAALAVTGRRRSSLPMGISHSDSAALLDSCDLRRNVGRRDYAVLTVLLRLGLRASEVAGLGLDDFDWSVGELTVAGKGGRLDRLPLPADVGGAIVAYLERGRPRTEHRRLFLRAIAPVGPLGRGGISTIVRRACRNAGLAEVGAHRLRHTAACEMLAAGSPLEEIGQVLRHRSVLSTSNYARVDLASLRTVAQPWPGSDVR
jgi:site-specific recombinase XerD